MQPAYLPQADGTARSNAALPVLSVDGIGKRFHGVPALHPTSFNIYPGEIVALLGKNGAGKSTLIKILAGVYTPDSGRLLFRNQALNARNLHGRIAFVHQDLGLIDWMTVAENIALGTRYARRAGLIAWRTVAAQARQALAMVDMDIDPDTRVATLSRAERSLVAIARGLSSQADLLVLDEPTASLPEADVRQLHQVLRKLQAQGVAMIYVSHRLDEVFALSDRIVVLRDGVCVADQATATTQPAQLIRHIIGREPDSVFVRPPAIANAPVVLSARQLCTQDAGPLDFEVRRGEILGLVGLCGAGQDHIGKALFGDQRIDSGHVQLNGRDVLFSHPRQAMRAGLCLVAGDRYGESIAPGLSICENLFLNPQASGRSLFSPRTASDEANEALRLGQQVALMPNDPDALIETLSGGNQQKAVIARWLRVCTSLSAQVLILEDPTAGVDISAKADIYRLLGEAVTRGMAVVLISSDFEEIAQVCHRVLVFRNGVIARELTQAQLSVSELLHCASLDNGDAPATTTSSPALH